jgi:hypothetical protein
VCRFLVELIFAFKWQEDPYQITLPMPYGHGLDTIVNLLSYFQIYAKIPKNAKSFAIHLLHDAPEWHEYSQSGEK